MYRPEISEQVQERSDICTDSTRESVDYQKVFLQVKAVSYTHLASSASFSVISVFPNANFASSVTSPITV